jgi:hypothetical protein
LPLYGTQGARFSVLEQTMCVEVAPTPTLVKMYILRHHVLKGRHE